MAMNEIPDALVNPPPDFGVMPFWFWNDVLDTAEINPSPPGPSGDDGAESNFLLVLEDSVSQS